jgi:hypothetical protein
MIASEMVALRPAARALHGGEDMRRGASRSERGRAQANAPAARAGLDPARYSLAHRMSGCGSFLSIETMLQPASSRSALPVNHPRVAYYSLPDKADPLLLARLGFGLRLCRQLQHACRLTFA